MKAHTNNYKNEIKEFGRQITSKITFGNTELGDEELNSVTPSFEGAILKSVMKKLEIDSNVDIPLETEINYQFGCLVGNAYEYLNFGNYIVFSSEKQEDTESYHIIAYDKMLYAMKDYESVGETYPTTIFNYIYLIAQKLGLTFKTTNPGGTQINFPNKSKIIPHELYLNADGESIGYTFRDVLDELAQVTASTICIEQDLLGNDCLVLKYINDTNDTIDEEYFNSINVTFGQKFGPVNSIVLSRAESDKVYLQDEESIEENGLCEICINDNQIMNRDDRSDYLPDILNQLDGLEYYINDFSSPGITYYDLCDKYNVSIGENTYPCIMFNDEIKVTQGLEEFVYTDMPEESETDYKKADKDDRKINQTKIVVDKHEQEISTLITQVGDRSEKTTSLTQDVDGLASEVSRIENLTIEASGYDTITLENLAGTNLGMLKIHPVNNLDIIRNIVSPMRIVGMPINMYVGNRGFTITNNENEFELLLPTNLYITFRMVDGVQEYVYDEFVIDGTERKTYVIHRIGLENGGYGPKYILDTPTIEEFPYEDIMLEEGDLTITYNLRTLYPGSTYSYIYAMGMQNNEFTNVFAQKVELQSLIEQTANSIGLSVQQFNDGDLVSSATILEQINNDESSVQINADKISLDGKTIDLTSDTINIDSTNFKVDTTGHLIANSGDIGGFELDSSSFTKDLSGIYDYSPEDVMLAYQIYKSYMNPYTNINYILDYNDSGSIQLADVSKLDNIVYGSEPNTRVITGTFEINSNNPKKCLVFKDNYGNVITTIGLGGINSDYVSAKNFICGTIDTSNDKVNGCSIDGSNGTLIINDTITGAYTKIEPGKITLHDSNGDKVITTTN